MPQNQIVPFATGDGANTLAYSAYATAGFLAQGFQAGVASSAGVNTALRQVSTVAAGLAQFTADNQAADVLDDGVPANFESKFTAAIKGALASSSVHYGVAAGNGDAMVVAAIPPLVATAGGGYQPGSFLIVKTPATANATTAPTINANTIANIDITKAGGSPLAAGDLPASTWIMLFFDGVGCDFLGITKSDVAAQIAQAVAAIPGVIYDTSADTSTSAATILAAATPAVTTRKAGYGYIVFPANACAGATQINVGFGLEPLTRSDASALVAGDYARGQPLVVIDDGTNMRLADLTPSQIAALVAADTAKISDEALWHIGTAAGTSTVMTTVLSPVPSEDTTPFCIRMAMPAFENGASPTLDFGFGAKPIVLNSTGAELAGGEMAGYADLTWDGADLRLMNSALASGAANSVTTTQIAPESVTAVRNLTIPGAISGNGAAQTVMTFNFNVPETGNALVTYSALCGFTAGPQGMIIEVYLDGNVLIPQIGGTAASFYTSNCVTAAALGLTAGNHTITATFNSPSSVNIYDQSCTVFVGAR